MCTKHFVFMEVSYLEKHFLFSGADFFPFTLETVVPNKYQLIATNPMSSKIYLIELS